MTSSLAERDARDDADESDATRALVGELARFLGVSVDASVIDREGAIPHRVLVELGKLGVFGLTVPEPWGGSGLSIRAACDVVRALARVDRSVATTVGLHLGLGTQGLIRFGTRSLQQAWLPAIAAGETIAAFSATEPGAGSDLTTLKTVARHHASEWTLNGAKAFVTNARIAKVLTVLSGTEEVGQPKQTQSLFCVDLKARGVSIAGEERKLGLRGSSTASIFFEDVIVPDAGVLGTVGRANEMLEILLSCGRTLLSAGCLGAADTAIARALEHTRERKQFGRTLDKLDVVRGQLDWMKATRAAMEALVFAAADADRSADAATFVRRSLAAKVFASDGAHAIADLALQLFGGSGFIEDTGIAMIVRDARVTRIFEGANDVLLTKMGALSVTEKTGSDDSDKSPIVDAYRGHRDEMRAKFGLRVLGHMRGLHRLGRISVLAEADKALLRAGVDSEVRRVWQDHARSEIAGLCALEMNDGRDAKS